MVNVIISNDDDDCDFSTQKMSNYINENIHCRTGTTAKKAWRKKTSQRHLPLNQDSPTLPKRRRALYQLGAPGYWQENLPAMLDNSQGDQMVVVMVVNMTIMMMVMMVILCSSQADQMLIATSWLLE